MTDIRISSTNFNSATSMHDRDFFAKTRIATVRRKKRRNGSKAIACRIDSKFDGFCGHHNHAYRV
jgi:hypothetical protein